MTDAAVKSAKNQKDEAAKLGSKIMEQRTLVVASVENTTSKKKNQANQNKAKSSYQHPRRQKKQVREKIKRPSIPMNLRARGRFQNHKMNVAASTVAFST